jgi:hypothetical protein
LTDPVRNGLFFCSISLFFFHVKRKVTNQASPVASVLAYGYAGQDARQASSAHKTRPCGLPCASRQGRAQRNSLSLRQALSSLCSMLLRRTGASSPLPAMLGAS